MKAAGEALREEQEQAARERVRRRTAKRRRNIDVLSQPGGIALADDVDRVRKRAQRLADHYRDDDLERAAVMATPGKLGVRLEKIIGTRDLVGVSYLAEGALAARAVCKLNIRDEDGGSLGSGSGSMVSPRLLLTNHHVFPDADTARSSAAEFDFEDGLNGQPRQSRRFPLDPDAFFVADEDRDFALVAVGGSESELAEYGFNPMIEAEGKAIIGDYVTIVQHPSGEKKMVALRENRVVDLDGSFIHYEADTEPGSSGSPVFSKEWELVGLHHASVDAPEHEEFGGILNEGIRISRILKFLQDKESDMSERERKLFKQLERDQIRPATPDANGAGTPRFATADDTGTVRVTVPLELSVRLGTPATAAAAVPPLTIERPRADSDGAAASNGSDVTIEKIEIDPDYSKRAGYDPSFLGTGKHKVPLPDLAPEQAATASDPLPYYHFSLVMNTDRRLAYYTAVNIDGTRDDDPKREPDKWSFDPRLPKEQQTGEAAYKKNPLDRGHLVRRIDPAWGDTVEERKLANDDTFHFTNCAPQHEDFNQNKETWAGLEDYVLRNAQTRDFKATVFSGPVFAADDDDFRGLVQLPRQYWKVVVMRKKSGEQSATAYLLSQAELIAGLEVATDFSYDAYKTFQVPIGKVERLTKLDFGSVKDADPLERPGQEANVPGFEVTGAGDLRL